MCCVLCISYACKGDKSEMDKKTVWSSLIWLALPYKCISVGSCKCITLINNHFYMWANNDMRVKKFHWQSCQLITWWCVQVHDWLYFSCISLNVVFCVYHMHARETKVRWARTLCDLLRYYFHRLINALPFDRGK